MPALLTQVDIELKQRFQKLSKSNGLSESELLRSIVIDAIKNIDFTDSDKLGLNLDFEKS